MKVIQSKDDKSSQRNRYFIIDKNPNAEVDVFAVDRDAAQPFYREVCRNIETASDFWGLTFYISARAPARLPHYGKDVVLLLIAEELYAHHAYYSRLLAIFRCLPVRPIYLDGFPLRAEHLSSLAHYGYKYLQYIKSLLRLLRNGEALDLRRSSARSMYIPLGCFTHFEPGVASMSSRDIDYAFLGSVTYNSSEKKWFHALMESPKETVRRLMCASMREVSATGRWRGFLHTTGDMKESMSKSNQTTYAEILGRCKISLVPRGTCYDTYRFFESLKAGCVVICEPLPDRWFYEGHPGIIIKNWRDLPRLLDRLLEDPDLLERKSREGLRFYNERCTQEVVAKRMVEFLNLRLTDGGR
jgi:Glycosyl transferases group 1